MNEDIAEAIRTINAANGHAVCVRRVTCIDAIAQWMPCVRDVAVAGSPPVVHVCASEGPTADYLLAQIERVLSAEHIVKREGFTVSIITAEESSEESDA